MNTLLFDAGNSRIKWALMRNGRLGTMRAVALGDLSTLQKWLARTANIGRVVGVCVAGATFERRLAATVKHEGLAAPEFVRSSDAAAGVRNGYREAWRLGDDRWAGLVGAWHRGGGRAVCAVSVGTALTIDLVDDKGLHRGGVIAPGPEMMLASLLHRTKGIARRATGRAFRGRRTLAPLADNTRDAIDAGCLLSAASLVDRTVTQLAQALDDPPVVFLTGGGAGSVEPLLQTAVTSCPELVLRGVAVIAGLDTRHQRGSARI